MYALIVPLPQLSHAANLIPEDVNILVIMLLGGSWVDITGAISPIIWDITSLITAHEPPSMQAGC